MRRILYNDTAFSLLRAGVALFFTIALTVVMLRPELQTIAGIPVLKIATQYHVSFVGHVLTFSLLFTLWCWALIPHFHPSSAPYIALLIVMALGIVGEFLQTFIAGRYASAADMTANGVGVVFAWWVWRTLSVLSTRECKAMLRYL